MSEPQEKLHLEIEELRIKNRWEPISRFMPAFAAVIACVGVFVTVIKYQSDQKAQQDQMVREQDKERASREVELRLRFQNQIRADIDQVLQFTHDQNQTLARASFLLENLKTLLESRINEKQTVGDVFDDYRKTISRSLVYVIAYDCNFIDKPRDLGFAEMVIKHWSDYSLYLSKDPVRYNFILYKYVVALSRLTDRNPAYFKAITYDSASDDFEVPERYDQLPNAEQRYQHFLDIINGFEDHLNVIGEDSAPEMKAIREKNVREFEDALCNPKISRVILGVHFTNQPCRK